MRAKKTLFKFKVGLTLYRHSHMRIDMIDVTTINLVANPSANRMFHYSFLTWHEQYNIGNLPKSACILF